jgi:hypothetical protein
MRTRNPQTIDEYRRRAHNHQNKVRDFHRLLAMTETAERFSQLSGQDLYITQLYSELLGKIRNHTVS